MDIVVAGTNAANEPGLYFIDYDNGTSAHLAPRFLRLADTDIALIDASADASRVAAGDFDANGFVDLAIIGSSGQGFLFRNDGQDLLVDITVLFGAGGSPQGLTVADVSLDGVPDLVVAGPTTVTVNDGAAGAGFGQILSLPSNISNDSVAVGDLDGDARPELLAVSTRTSDVTVFRNLSAAPLILRLGGAGGDDWLYWLDQGAGATYWVARGDLHSLWTTRDLGAGTCLRSNIPTPNTTDADPLPPRQAPPSVFAALSAWWYLVKCAGGECTSPTFGQDSNGIERFGGARPPDPCP